MYCSVSSAALASEMTTGAERHPGVVKRCGGELPDVAVTGDRHRLGDVREEIEGRLGLGAAHAGHRDESGMGSVATALEFAEQARRSGGVAEGLDPGVLHEVSGATLVVGVEFRDLSSHLVGRDGAAEPPTGHGELLREGVQDDGALRHPGQRGDRCRGSRVAHLEVRLIGEHPEVVLDGESSDLGHLLGRALAAERVLQVVVDQQPGLGASSRMRSRSMPNPVGVSA